MAAFTLGCLQAIPITAEQRGTLICFGGTVVPEWTGWTLRGEIDYSGAQTGMLFVIAAPDAVCWDGALADLVTRPGPYLLAADPVEINCWVKAYRDSNANGRLDEWEACGEYPLNPLRLTGSASGVNLFLSDPDSDQDGLADWWELEHFGELSQSELMDSDGDGVANGVEYAAGSSPVNMDSDGDGVPDGADAQPAVGEDSDSDGLPDDWERRWFGDVSHDGAEDADGDALDNRTEYLLGTDPLSINLDASGDDFDLNVYAFR